MIGGNVSTNGSSDGHLAYFNRTGTMDLIVFMGKKVGILVFHGTIALVIRDRCENSIL